MYHKIKVIPNYVYETSFYKTEKFVVSCGQPLGVYTKINVRRRTTEKLKMRIVCKVVSVLTFYKQNCNFENLKFKQNGVQTSKKKIKIKLNSLRVVNKYLT